MSKITSVEELAKKVKNLSVLYKASEADIEIIEAFIRTTLTNRDKEIVAMCEGMKKVGLEDVNEWLPEHGYNEALDDIIKLLQ